MILRRALVGVLAATRGPRLKGHNDMKLLVAISSHSARARLRRLLTTSAPPRSHQLASALEFQHEAGTTPAITAKGSRTAARTPSAGPNPTGLNADQREGGVVQSDQARTAASANA